MLIDIEVSQEYKTTPETLFSVIENGALFELTGADKISVDFKVNGKFILEFNNRGTISGVITHIISPNQLWMKWDVEGFGMETEKDTQVKISILKRSKTELTLNHGGIKTKASAEAKKKAWTEILNDLQYKR